MRHAVVLMAARETSAYIEEAMRSVRESAARVAGWHVTLLVAVDACEETALALRLLGEPHYWSPEHVGCFLLRNSLAALAGPGVDAFLPFDSDDVMLPDYLPSLLTVVTPDTMAGAARYEVGEQLEHASPPTVRLWRCVGGSCAIGAEAWRRLGGYWTAHRTAMDTELCDRARRAHIAWRAVDTPLFLRRRNPRSLTQSYRTTWGSAMRAAAVADIAQRKQDKSLIEIPLDTTPLTFWHPQWDGGA